MSVRKLESGKWQADAQPGGRLGKRIRKTFTTRREAEAWLRTLEEKPELAQKETRRLSALIKTWYELHGSTLRQGYNRLQVLERLCKALGDPLARKLNAEDFASYRRRRIDEGLSENSANREQSYLSAVYSELEKLGVWKHGNPLKMVRKIKIQARELSYLTDDQVDRLLDALDQADNPHVRTIALVCLATGCRWSEAEGLTIRQIHGNKIQFARTKSGKTRAVPIAPELADELRRRAQQGGRIFGASVDAFSNALQRAGIELPSGQKTHVLRHTFASHFMQAGGNILTLQRILGHSNVTVTMQYAHLAPDHLEDALTLNPLARRQSVVT